VKISTVSKSGKISCADFLTLLGSFDNPKGKAFLAEIQRRVGLEAVPEEVQPKAKSNCVRPPQPK
jgi:hypothetical protein